MLKKIIALPLSYILFWIGHLTSMLLTKFPSLYCLYDWAMCNSVMIQEWAGLEKPWNKVDRDNNK